MKMQSFDPQSMPTAELQEYIQGAIAPRPVAWVSTIGMDGVVNLSPFSYFNIFSSNPPVLIFSPARRVRDNTTKHTLKNCQDTGECVVNICSYATLEQMVISSGEYPDGVNEFEKSGLTELDSIMVKPPRVAEAVAQMECKVLEIKSLGDGPGAGNLIICEVIYLHILSDAITDQKKIDPVKMDQISRMGSMYYSRAMEGLFQLAGPGMGEGIGFDMLPECLKMSIVLSGNNLGRLARTLPKLNPEKQQKALDLQEITEIKLYEAKSLIDNNQAEEAWQILLS